MVLTHQKFITPENNIKFKNSDTEVEQLSAQNYLFSLVVNKSKWTLTVSEVRKKKYVPILNILLCRESCLLMLNSFPVSLAARNLPIEERKIIGLDSNVKIRSSCYCNAIYIFYSYLYYDTIVHYLIETLKKVWGLIYWKEIGWN